MGEDASDGHGGGVGVYQMFGRNGVMLGGMFNSSPQMPAPPGWLHYVLVDDVNRAVEAVKTSGRASRSTARWKCQAATGSRSAWIPQGAMFAVHARRNSAL